MLKKIKNYHIYTALIILSVLLGLIAINILPDFVLSDGSRYNAIANHLLENGEWLVIDEKISPPAYPVFLSIVYGTLGTNHDSAFLVQFILLGIMSAMGFALAKKLLNFSKLQSLLFSILILFWPYLIIYAKLMYTEALYVPLLFLGIYCLFRFYKHPSLSNAALSGITIGLAVLTRPVAILLPFWLFGGLIIILALTKKIKENKILIKYSLIGIIIFIFTIAPWITYASYKMDNFTLIASNLSSVNNNANQLLGYEHTVYKTPGYEPGAEITTKKYIVSKLKNIYRFWDPGASGYNMQALVEKIPIAKYAITIYKIIYFIILALAFLSILLIKKNKLLILPWLIILYFWAVHTALYPYPRFTLPIIPLVILLAIYTSCNSKYLYKYL